VNQVLYPPSFWLSQQKSPKFAPTRGKIKALENIASRNQLRYKSQYVSIASGRLLLEIKAGDTSVFELIEKGFVMN
jgi:hypothetical protein